MLILTRRVGETINIGPDVQVQITAISGHQVRVGITAPRNVVVDRSEISERKLMEKVHA